MRGLRAKARQRPLRGVLLHALVLLTLVAFTLQGFLTQTHIHRRQPAGAPSIVDTFDGAPAKGGDKAPSKNSDQNCPLCQQFASAGSFVTPSAAATLLPAFSVSIIDVVVHAARTRIAVTHHWRGRAPPRH